MRILFTLLLSAATISTFCQPVQKPTTLTIVGRHNYVDKAVGYGMNILLMEDPNKCDPVRGFIPLEEQLKHFNESLIAIGFDRASMAEIKNYTTHVNKQKEFSLTISDLDGYDQISTLLISQDIKVTKEFFRFKEKPLSQQDALAINALHDAKEKAELIADHLGMRINKILNIDDDTRIPSIFTKGKISDMASYYKLVELLSMLELDEDENNKSGAYTLRVTFELVE